MHVKLPDIPAQSTLTRINTKMLTSEANIERAHIQKIDVTAVAAPNMMFDEVIAEHLLCVEARLDKLGLRDVILQKCDLSAARISEGSCIRVRFAQTRITGTDLSVSIIKDVTFEDCKLDMANFRSAKLTRVLFKNCTLKETDFQSATLSHVTFQDCILEKTVFDHVDLKDVDVRSSQLFDIRGWGSLKGLTIDQLQLTSIAPQLALKLGLNVEN